MSRASFILPFLIVLATLSACTTRSAVPYNRPLPEYSLPAQADDAFADLELKIRNSRGEQISGFELLDRNTDGLRWRLALIDSAKHSIDVQYYLWYGDSAGRLLVKRLLDAADRGVRVRMLVDDLNTLLQDAGSVALRDNVAAWVDAHANIELRLFNPWTNRELAGRFGESLGEFKRINQRMHNKALIVDNRAVILGGRNVGNEYLGFNRAFNFHDLDVLGIGPVARQTSAAFDSFWNSRWVMSVSALQISVSPDGQAAGRRQLLQLLTSDAALNQIPIASRSWSSEIDAIGSRLKPGTSVVMADKPTDDGFEHVMLDKVRSMISSADSELLIANAYIIPTEWAISTLTAMHSRGVRTRILTNSLASHDVPAVNSHYRQWRKPILESGAELYELRHDAAMRSLVGDTPPTQAKFLGLHSKAMVVDRRHVYIGSMNYDPRSALINSEMGAFIDSPELAEALAVLMERDIEPGNSWRVELNDKGSLTWVNDVARVSRQPARNFWQRIEDIFFRAFPKEYY